MNVGFPLALFGAFSLALAGAAEAQQRPTAGDPPASPDSAAPPEQSITVIGEPPADAEQRRREAGDYVDSHAVATRIGQLARWHERICVRTWGLPLELNAYVSNRVMDVAEQIGLPADRSELCRPNVRIGFTSAPQSMIEQAARRNRLILGFHYARQRDQLMRIRQPVQAWYVTTTQNGNGEEEIDEAGVRAVGGGAGSRLSAYVSSGFAHVLIFADARIAAGQEVDSIADLLAFVALAQTPVADECDASATILNVLNPNCPPARRLSLLTRQDMAYLTALYRVHPELGPELQRGEVVLHMARQLGDR